MDSFQRAQTIAAYKRLFLKGTDGKEVLNNLASEAMLDASTFENDPYRSAYNQGKRDIVLNIFALLNVDLRQYLLGNTTLEDIE